MKISIVVPAFNEERLLGESLAQIKSAAGAFTQRGWDFEMIVCDNNSTDRTAEIARAAGATVVFEPVNQIARARNSGAAAATGDWLVFVDADSHPGADLFADVAEQITSGRCLAGGATIRLDEKLFCRRIDRAPLECGQPLAAFAGRSVCFYRDDSFPGTGRFQHRIFVGEELELSQRLKKLAKKTGKRVVILHRHPLVTSARKMRIYTLRQHLTFLFCMILNPYRTVTSREKAHLWYDGRR